MTAESPDPIWDTIRAEVENDVKKEPALRNFFQGAVLDHRRLEDALGFHLASKLESPIVGAAALRELMDEAFRSDPSIGESLREDIGAVCSRDPACRGFSYILLYYKGFHALQAYRVGHHFWTKGRIALASYLQSRVSEVFGVDIHPAARIGKGILIDHATSVVIGETAVVEDNVSMLHEVTLGGTGKQTGDRHPKVRRGVLIAAGAKILGNVEVGEGAKVGSCAVVLEDVPPHTTVVGIPARVVGKTHNLPALDMDHRISEGAGI